MIELISTNIATYGPFFIGAMAMLETALIIGIIVPTEITIIAATALVLEGHLNFVTVVVAILLGATLGDSCGFMLGRFGGNRFLYNKRHLTRLTWRKNLLIYHDRASTLFGRYGILSISCARMIPFVRTLMPLFAGSTRVSYRRFLVFDFLGVVGWAVMGLSFAYGVARGWQIGMEYLGTFWVAVITLSAIVLFLFFKNRILGSSSTGGHLSIGLTGNVAAGKSAVAKCWSGEGISVVSADELAREAVKIGSPGLEEIVSAFGKDILNADGSLNRKVLRHKIFNDKDARDNLEAILHPRIWVLRDRWTRERLNEGVAITVSEVPLLFEAGLEDDFDVTVLVDAPEDIRMSRLTSGRGLDAEEARKIIASQMAPEFKRNKADYVLVNDRLPEDLMLSAHEILDQIRKQTRSDQGPSSGRIRIDMHLHTRASFDCLSDPYRVLEAAQNRGVQRIAITDHNCLAMALDMAKEFPDSVIPGEEVSTAEGIDVIGLYIKEEIPKGIPAKEVCRIIGEQGGIVYLPHPYARGKGGSGRYAEELVPLVDVVEVFNGRLHPGSLNKPGEELAARWSKARGAGSDAHTIGEVAGAFIEVVDHPNEPALLLEALATAQIRGATTPWSVHLASTWAKFRKQFPF